MLSLVEIGPVVLGEKTFKIRQRFCSNRNYLPFEKVRSVILVPFTQGYFVPSLVEIGSKFLEKIFFQIRQCICAIS